MDPARWPLSLSTALPSALQGIKEGFIAWIEVFPKFKGNLTPEIMGDLFDKIIAILTDENNPDRFFCKNRLSSPSAFWTLLIHQYGDQLHPDFARLVFATISIAYGGADSER